MKGTFLASIFSRARSVPGSVPMILASYSLPAGGDGDAGRLVLLDQVVVGQDVAVGGDEETGAADLDGVGLRLALAGLAEEAVEEVVAEWPFAAVALGPRLLPAVGLDADDGRSGLFGDGDEVQGRLLLGQGRSEQVDDAAGAVSAGEHARNGRFSRGDRGTRSPRGAGPV